MIDLKINNAGDLVTSNHDPLCTLKLTWKITDRPTVRLIFKTGPNVTEKDTSDNLAPPFILCIDTMRAADGKSVDACSDEEEIRQQIILMTRAAARIVRAKHKDITDEAVVNEIYEAVLEQVQGILGNPSVVIKKEHLEAHPFSWQNLNVYIYDDDKEIYNFQLEV